ncbi:hypothetical protein GYMLUDRAFT_168743 [Collybiopsis luxurians FD-317 M1]|uniref:Unplaced genomic scaffold GYMLUscaffold_30, whole genome shotgun sequence n=1 Tax=Collybiopsis luxurians FD-317 M1 TaxID=944289 RepID=A0A0D0CMG9_9AGAR|nr:hypothetical protein GYMLUDRAFT_168743 [Collybiopsis luxurians FD-317 M1]
MSQCSECAGPIVWNEDAASNICTSCGTLTDPCQRVLTNTNDQFDSQYLNSSTPNILKRFRGGYSWNLAGEGKEVRVRNNTYTMHEFIKSLSRTLSVPGLSPRVCNLFDQAMRTKQFRWGTKAKLVAAACLSIALRESGHPDSIKDIAFLLEQSDISIKRTLSSILAVMNLTLTPTGPAQYLPALQSHLSSILQSPVESSGLAVSLYSELRPLSIRSATETARLFIDILARFAPEVRFTQLSPAAVACAIFILSLEAEKRGSLSHLADISACFAKEFQVAKVTVMQRYEALQEEVAKWTKEVEWLDSYKKSKGHAKVSKRLICARGLKDALNWKHGLWEKRIEAGSKHILHIDSESESECRQDSFKSSLEPSRKRRKMPSAVSNATYFLLDPLNVSSSPKASNSTSGPSFANPASSTKRSTDACTMPSYLLSVSSGSPMYTIPSRLQQLSVARGGAGFDVIEDEDLLADGEWEAIQRTPEEIQQLEQQWRDEGILEFIEKAEKAKKIDSAALQKRKKSKTAQDLQTFVTRRSPSKRINLEALSNFMDENGEKLEQMPERDSFEFLGLEFAEEKENEYFDEIYDARDANAMLGADEDEITIDDWRPISPGLDGNLYNSYCF